MIATKANKMIAVQKASCLHASKSISLCGVCSFELRFCIENGNRRFSEKLLLNKCRKVLSIAFHRPINSNIVFHWNRLFSLKITVFWRCENWREFLEMTQVAATKKAYNITRRWMMAAAVWQFGYHNNRLALNCNLSIADHSAIRYGHATAC